MKISEKAKKIWRICLAAALCVNTVLWSLTWRLDYDVSPGVFGRGSLSVAALAAALTAVAIAALPVFFSEKKDIDCGSLLCGTEKRGSEAAALVSCFIIASSVLTFLKSSDGGNRVVALIVLLLSVPAAVYFASVCILRDQNAKIIRICSPFTPVWGIFMTLYHYLSTARAINDPVKIICQFMPVSLMLFAAAEMKTRLAQCSKAYFSTSRAMLFVTGSLACSLIIDSVTVLVASLISRLGGDVSPDFLMFATRPHELTLAVATLGAAFYALNRKDKEPAPEKAEGEETGNSTENNAEESAENNGEET